MGFIATLILWIVLFTVSQLLTPEPDIENARARGLNDFNFPTATEGRVIPLHWGRDKVKGPNVLWYGDLSAIPIKEKIRVSMFKKKTIITGHRYYIGLQMGICVGPAILKAVYVGDELAWSGTQATDGVIEINAKNLGGNFHFYTGSRTQTKSSYLSGFQNPCPAYRGTCHGVFMHGYVGESTSISPWSFVVERIPIGLGGGDEAVNDGDCGLMHVAYELFTDIDWGYGYPDSDIDIPNFQAVAATLKSEGNGITMMLTSKKEATEILHEIERQADCHFRIDPTTGKWKCELVRDGYSLTGLKVADVSSVKEMGEYSRGGWDATVNIVRIAYKRRANNYSDGYAQAQDPANMRVQGRRVPTTYSYVGVRDDDLANSIAWRDIRTNSYPLAKVRFKGTRLFWDSFVGEVILLTWVFKDFSVNEVPFRIIRLDSGVKKAPEITVDAVQDVFSWKAASSSSPEASRWTPPETALIPFPAENQLAFESPYAFTRRDEVTNEGRIWTVGEAPGRTEDGYEVLQRNGSGVPTGDYFTAGNTQGFTDVGELDSGIDNDDTVIDVITNMSITEVESSAAVFDVGEHLLNLLLINDEMIGFTGVAAITGGFQLTGCLRGFCDTAQAKHEADDKVWFLSTGGDLTATVFDPDYNVELKLLPYRQTGEVVSDLDVGITNIDVDMGYRERRPYPPTFLDWNSSQYPATVDITGDVIVDFNRRDFRIYNEASQNHVDAATINGDFPANNSTKYQLKLYDGVSLVYTGDWNAGAATLTITFEQILRYMDGLPPTLKMAVNTKHTHTAVDYESIQEVLWEATVQSSLYDNDFWLGVVSPSTASNSWTAPDTGSYGFTIGASISGDVEARINSGSWVQVIVSGNTTGSLAGVTANDTIEFRHLDSSSSDEVLLTINSPTSSVDALGIIVFA